MTQEIARLAISTARIKVPSDFRFPPHHGELRPSQKEGVYYMRTKRRAINADDPGLGKTVQAILAVESLGSLPCVVVCPPGITVQWQFQVRTWLREPRTVYVCRGRRTSEKVPHADYYIIGYSVLDAWVDTLRKKKPRAVIFDESHYIKNRSKRTTVARKLARNVETRFALSATPVVNRPSDLVSQLAALGRLDEMGGFWGFTQRFCGGHQGPWGYDMSGATNLPELALQLAERCFVRRTKEMVLKELPAIQRNMHYIDVGQEARNQYLALRNLALQTDDADATRPGSPLVSNIAHARAKLATAKALVVEEWMGDFLESGRKLVVFVWHRELGARLRSRFHCGAIEGGMSATERARQVSAFAAAKGGVPIIVSLAAGATGLDGLQHACSDVVFAEIDWTAALLEQAEGRLDRLGQREPVSAWYLIGKDSIDEDVLAIVARKLAIVGAVRDAGRDGELPLLGLIRRLRSGAAR